MILKEKEFILGVIIDSILEIGKIIKWMEKEFLFGLTKESTRGNIKMIKKKDMEYLSGMTVRNIEGTGRKANNMEKESFTSRKRKYGRREFGMLGRN